MKGIGKLLKISEIGTLKEVYPRKNVNISIVKKYAYDMKHGAEFPPIKVAKLLGTHKFDKLHPFQLIDGKHRLDAKKLLKEEYIKVVDYGKMTKSEILIEATKSNFQNGVPFSMADRLETAKKLKKLSVDIASISSLLLIPIDKFSLISLDEGAFLRKGGITDVYTPNSFEFDDDEKYSESERVFGFIVTKFHWALEDNYEKLKKTINGKRQDIKREFISIKPLYEKMLEEIE